MLDCRFGFSGSRVGSMSLHSNKVPGEAKLLVGATLSGKTRSVVLKYGCTLDAPEEYLPPQVQTVPMTN